MTDFKAWDLYISSLTSTYQLEGTLWNITFPLIYFLFEEKASSNLKLFPKQSFHILLGFDRMDFAAVR